MAADTGTWRAKAVVVSTAGLIFSLLLSFCIVLGNYFGLPGMATIKRAGIDASMQVFVTFPWITDRPQDNGGRFAFVDVDNKSCLRFADETTCGQKEPVPVALVSDFLRAAEVSGASIIIVDVMPDDDQRQAKLLSALQQAGQQRGGPWIIGLLPGRTDYVGDRLEQTTDLPQIAIGGASRLRLASAVTTSDANALDGVIRSYPLLTFVKASGSRDFRPMPTVPFLAAMLADPHLAGAADCIFYRSPICPPAAPTAPLKLENLIRLGRDGSLENRIFYTLPGLSLLREDVPLDAGVYTGRYDHFPASFFKGNHFDIPQEDALRGRIVVLGSSTQQAEDLHLTPIGPMSGAEVVLNATRAIYEFSAIGARRAPAQSEDLFRELGERLRSALVGFLVFLPGWLIIFWLNARTWRDSLSSILLRNALVTLVFCTALVAALVIEFTWSIADLRHSAEAGIEIDMLTPVLALGLEGFAEAAKALGRTLERAVEWLALPTSKIATRIWSKLGF